MVTIGQHGPPPSIGRAAGAAGGTVLHAKGTGGTRGEKFFSVSLADEKDMIYIIAHKDEKANKKEDRSPFDFRKRLL